MKKKYLKPELEKYATVIESLLKTDSYGWGDPSLAGGKENNLIFEEDDNFGDTWGVDSNNLWGDED